MIPKKKMITVRFNDDEMEKVEKQLKEEHLDYVSTFIRKAVFFYIEYTTKLKEKYAKSNTNNE